MQWHGTAIEHMLYEMKNTGIQSEFYNVALFYDVFNTLNLLESIDCLLRRGNLNIVPL